MEREADSTAAEPEPASLLDDEVLGSLRLLLVDDDPERGAAFVRALRGLGGVVVQTTTDGRGLLEAANLDPEIVLGAPGTDDALEMGLGRKLRAHPRLRWAGIVRLGDGPGMPDPGDDDFGARVAALVRPLVTADRRLERLARTRRQFAARVDSIGPIRTLRALGRADGSLRLTLSSPQALAELDLSDGLIAGATWIELVEGTPRELVGTPALAALLELRSGLVFVERRARPELLDIMVPVEEAVGATHPAAPATAPVDEPPTTPAELSATHLDAAPSPSATGQGTVAEPDGRPGSPDAETTSVGDLSAPDATAHEDADTQPDLQPPRGLDPVTPGLQQAPTLLGMETPPADEEPATGPTEPAWDATPVGALVSPSAAFDGLGDDRGDVTSWSNSAARPAFAEEGTNPRAVSPFVDDEDGVVRSPRASLVPDLARRDGDDEDQDRPTVRPPMVDDDPGPDDDLLAGPLRAAARSAPSIPPVDSLLPDPPDADADTDAQAADTDGPSEDVPPDPDTPGLLTPRHSPFLHRGIETERSFPPPDSDAEQGGVDPRTPGPAADAEPPTPVVADPFARRPASTLEGLEVKAGDVPGDDGSGRPTSVAPPPALDPGLIPTDEAPEPATAPEDDGTIAHSEYGDASTGTAPVDADLPLATPVPTDEGLGIPGSTAPSAGPVHPSRARHPRAATVPYAAKDDLEAGQLSPPAGATSRKSADDRPTRPEKPSASVAPGVVAPPGGAALGGDMPRAGTPTDLGPFPAGNDSGSGEDEETRVSHQEELLALARSDAPAGPPDLRRTDRSFPAPVSPPDGDRSRRDEPAAAAPVASVVPGAPATDPPTAPSVPDALDRAVSSADTEDTPAWPAPFEAADTDPLDDDLDSEPTQQRAWGASAADGVWQGDPIRGSTLPDGVPAATTGSRVRATNRVMTYAAAAAVVGLVAVLGALWFEGGPLGSRTGTPTTAATDPSAGGTEAPKAPAPQPPGDPAPAAAANATPPPAADPVAVADPDGDEADDQVPAGDEDPAREADAPDLAEAAAADGLPSNADPAPEESGRDQERSDALVREARDLLEDLGNPDRIERLLQDALAADDRNPRAERTYAEFLMAQNRADLALPHAERAVSLRKRRLSYRILLGDVHFALGNLAQARRAWELVLEREPNHPVARNRVRRLNGG